MTADRHSTLTVARAAATAGVPWSVRRRPRRGAASADRGSATVWAAGAVAALLVIGTVGIDLASAVRARHVAESAADLSALAAAGRASEGPDEACSVARTRAELNGAALRDCRLDGWDAVVRVEVGRAWTLVGRGPATAAARAGPVPVDTASPSGGPTPDDAAPPAPAASADRGGR